MPSLKAPGYDSGSSGEIPSLRQWAFECMQPGHSYSRGIGDNTFKTNEVIRRVWLNNSEIGGMRLDTIEKRHCQRYINKIKDQKSPSYIQRIGAFFSAIFAQAVEHGHIPVNPFAGVKYPEIPERENRTLTPKEAMNLLNPDTRFECMVTIAMFTGMSRGEICRMKWDDVKEGHIRVQRTKRGKVKGNAPLTPECKAALDQQPRVIIGKNKYSPYVFTVEGGGPVDPHNFTRDFRKWKARLGIPVQTRLQDLRGSYGSLLIESGADIKTVQELMRHKDPRTTMKMYLRSRQETQQHAVDTMLAAVKNTPKKAKKEKTG